MPHSLRTLLVAGAVLISAVSSQGVPQLTGTWTTKSRQVITGPGFYDPVNEKMFEPSLTGFSYSFTDDGYYEVAYYRAISNPGKPSCPQGIIQWQHGTFTAPSNGSLILTPFGVDGRQLLSNPCLYPNSVYTRYTQSELFRSYELLTDSYSKAPRLNLFAFDGTPLNPMYQAYKPPIMLPTQTLNPTTASSTGGATATASTTGKAKRSHFEPEDDLGVPLNRNVLMKRKEPINADKWWWIGAGMTAIGGVGYFCF